MPLQFRQINTRSVSALQQAVKRISPMSQPLMHTIGAIFPIQNLSYDATQPAYPLYLLGVNDIINPEAQLAAAKQTGWLYIINPEMTATVAGEDEAENHIFSSFTSGSLAADVTQCVKDLSHNKSLSGNAYEICLLNIPALHVICLWLKTGTAAVSDDLLMPVQSAQPALSSGDLLSVADFFGALHAPALQMAGRPSF